MKNRCYTMAKGGMYTLNAIEMKRLLISFFSLLSLPAFSQEPLNAEWLRMDSLLYRQLDSVLQQPGAPPIDYFKRMSKSGEMEKSDLGFGFSKISFNRYGGYVSVHYRLLVYGNRMVQYQILASSSTNAALSLFYTQFSKSGKSNPQSWSYTDSAWFRAQQDSIPILQWQQPYITEDSLLREAYQLLTQPLSGIVFGRQCGYGLEEPAARIAINIFTARKDTVALRSILRGLNPEGRVYAMEELLLLGADEAILLTSDDKQFMKMLLLMDTPISACGGCDFEQAKAAELIAGEMTVLLDQ